MAGSGIALLQRWWNRLTLAGLVLCALVAPLAWWAGGTSWIAVVVGTLLLPLAAVALGLALGFDVAVVFTQPAVDLIQLVGKYMFSGGAGGGAGQKPNDGAQAPATEPQP